jgi:hypothetical protein
VPHVNLERVRDGTVRGPHVLDEVHVLLVSGSSKWLPALAHMPTEAMRALAVVAPRNVTANGGGKRLASFKENEPVGGEPPWPPRNAAGNRRVKGPIGPPRVFEREGTGIAQTMWFEREI